MAIPLYPSITAMLSGSVAIDSGTGAVLQVEANEPLARFPLAHHQPRLESITAADDCQIIRFNSDRLDSMLAWDQAANYIILDITGWYLAGLVSSVGSALIGIWLLIANRLHRRAPELPRGLIMLGMTTGIFMIIGWLALAGVIARIDDPQLAPWYVSTGLLNWMGTYLLYPIWCLWLSRRSGG